MSDINQYIILAIFVLGMNVVPAFMPPTWTILVFFFLTYHLLPLPVIIIGAVAATSGRIVLYFLARNHFIKLLPKSSQQNMSDFGKYFYTHKHITIPALLMYAFLPIPSNQVYISAGFAKLEIKLIASLFFFGRIVSYSSWIATAHIASKTMSDIFTRNFTSANKIIVEIGSLCLIYLFTIIPWRRLVNGKKKSK